MSSAGSAGGPVINDGRVVGMHHSGSIDPSGKVGVATDLRTLEYLEEYR